VRSAANPETATEAVALAAARLGIVLPPGAALAFAAAAVTHADNVFAVRAIAWREQWTDAGYRAYTRKKMLHQLHEGLITAEMLPVTLPYEALTYLEDSFGASRGRPVPESAAWNSVEISLRVPTRRARGVS
jgi:hypothetical protein